MFAPLGSSVQGEAVVQHLLLLGLQQHHEVVQLLGDVHARLVFAFFRAERSESGYFRLHLGVDVGDLLFFWREKGRQLGQRETGHDGGVKIPLLRAKDEDLLFCQDH